MATSPSEVMEEVKVNRDISQQIHGTLDAHKFYHMHDALQGNNGKLVKANESGMDEGGLTFETISRPRELGCKSVTISEEGDYDDDPFPSNKGYHLPAPEHRLKQTETNHHAFSISDVIGLGDVYGNKRLLQMLVAEVIGTLFLVLIGCGSCLTGWSPTYSPGVVQISLAFGIAVATLAQAIGHVSGAHLNPAVTIGLLAAGQCSILKGACFIGAQCLGSICGSVVLQAITPTKMQGNLGMTLLHEDVDPIQGLFVEALITFVLVLTVCGVSDDLRKDVKGSAPLAIGLSITVCHLMAINHTGASMNPARSLGPALVNKIWTNHWVYWAGPMLGGFSAGFLYQLIFKERLFDDNETIPDIMIGEKQE